MAWNHVIVPPPNAGVRLEDEVMQKFYGRSNKPVPERITLDAEFRMADGSIKPIGDGPKWRKGLPARP